jgi:stromal membrane-associated protein
MTSDKVKKELKDLLKDPSNRYCADCGKRGPTWASINLGCFVCLSCSGIHRSMGTHVSQVRSVDLDTWKPEWVAVMKEWGNEKANSVWEAKMPEGYDGKPTETEAQDLTPKMQKFIKDKYERKKFYSAKGKERVAKKEESEEEEVEKPKPKQRAPPKAAAVPAAKPAAKSVAKPVDSAVDSFNPFADDTEFVSAPPVAAAVAAPSAAPPVAAKPAFDLMSLYAQSAPPPSQPQQQQQWGQPPQPQQQQQWGQPPQPQQQQQQQWGAPPAMTMMQQPWQTSAPFPMLGQPPQQQQQPPPLYPQPNFGMAQGMAAVPASAQWPASAPHPSRAPPPQQPWPAASAASGSSDPFSGLF